MRTRTATLLVWQMKGAGPVVVVEITGWQVGFNKIACTQLVRAAAGYGLSDAKRITDGILDGDVQRIWISSEETAANLVRDLNAIGAVAKLGCSSEDAL